MLVKFAVVAGHTLETLVTLNVGAVDPAKHDGGQLASCVLAFWLVPIV